MTPRQPELCGHTVVWPSLLHNIAGIVKCTHAACDSLYAMICRVRALRVICKWQDIQPLGGTLHCVLGTIFTAAV